MYLILLIHAQVHCTIAYTLICIQCLPEQSLLRRVHVLGQAGSGGAEDTLAAVGMLVPSLAVHHVLPCTNRVLWNARGQEAVVHRMRVAALYVGIERGNIL